MQNIWQKNLFLAVKPFKSSTKPINEMKSDEMVNIVVKYQGSNFCEERIKNESEANKKNIAPPPLTVGIK
nr:hypothetical protein GTC16762_08530 [Pigmentibacter ruber]